MTARDRPSPTTAIATSSATTIEVRGKDLCHDLIGRVGFTEMTCLLVLGRVPPPAQIRVVDACLVALAEHGLTPSAIAARLVYGSAPEALQGGVAAGLLGVGGQMVGTVEGAARLLGRIADAGDLDGEAAAVVAEHRAVRAPLPGFGHPVHAPDDPRTARLFEVAGEVGLAGRHVDAVLALGRALDAALGRHVTINATGAIAAVLSDCGIPPAIMRGFALIARCAGLVGHLREEQVEPAMSTMWDAVERAVPYHDRGASAPDHDRDRGASAPDHDRGGSR